MIAGAVAALLVGGAVALWPRRSSDASAALGLAAAGPATGGSVPGVSPPPGPGFWQQDPVDLYRRWRLRRRPGDLLEDVLEVLRGIGPALESGLTPSRAIILAATSVLGGERVERARDLLGSRRRRSAAPGSAPDIDLLVAGLLEAAERAAPMSAVWSEWAGRSRSVELAFVAAAWRLSETTGAPLSSAVDRAVRGLLDARTRRGKVAVAVAGPRATVTVLTVLPLTGPLFGLACGIDPVSLYLGSPVATAAATAGVLLVWFGRVWCRRMIHSAVRP